MMSFHRGWAAVCGLAWKVGAATAMAVAISFSLPAGVGDDDPDAARDALPDASVDRIDVTRVAMRLPAGKPFAFYSLEDEEGREMVRVTYARRGDVVINVGEGFPVRLNATARPDGTCEFVATDLTDIMYRLKLRPGGTSGFSVTDNVRRVRDGLGVNREGEMVRDASIID